MGNLAAAQFDDDPAGGAPPPEPPQVFVRTFAIPAGMPWDQARAAQLEARHGAPLPIAELVHRLKRLGGWAPGAAARFAVFYVRRRDYAAPFETILDVDGVPVRVAFGSRTEQLKRTRVAAVVAVAFVAAGLLAMLAATKVLATRSEADRRLEGLEQRVAAQARLAQKIQAERDLTRELTRLQGSSGSPADVLADIGWVARAKTPGARIVALHWDHGLLAIEARGEAAPIISTEREVVRAPRPIRPGIWLWGVSRSPAAIAPPPPPGRGP